MDFANNDAGSTTSPEADVWFSTPNVSIEYMPLVTGIPQASSTLTDPAFANLSDKRRQSRVAVGDDPLHAIQS